AGRRLLKSITEAEPPAHLVHNILAATSGFDTARMHAPLAQPQVSWLDRVRAWMAPTLTPVLAVIRQPRFAMSFGMAFFSVSMVLNLAGVKFSDLRHVDLHPSAIVRGYHMTSDRKSTRLNSSHVAISYAVFCLKKKNKQGSTYSAW